MVGNSVGPSSDDYFQGRLTSSGAHRNFKVDGTEEAKAERYPNRIWSDASFDSSDLDSQELSLSIADPFAVDEN